MADEVGPDMLEKQYEGAPPVDDRGPEDYEDEED